MGTPKLSTHAYDFLTKIGAVATKMAADPQLNQMAADLVTLRERKGRLFVIGLGGGAGHASHAASDLRKLCGIEAYAPSDNVSELTARANDEGWDTIYSGWLKVSQYCYKDGLLVLSVGGGDSAKNISMPLIRAMELARTFATPVVLGVVGRKGGAIDDLGTCVVHVPLEGHTPKEWMTPLTESFQAVVWHMLVSHPYLQQRPTKW